MTPEKMLQEYLRSRSDLSRRYRDGARDRSPPRLDAAILAEARKAVGTPAAHVWRPFGSSWAVPLSAAAVVVLSVALGVFMSQEGVAPWQSPPAAVAPAEPAPAAQTATDSRRTDEPASRAAVMEQAKSAGGERSRASAAPAAQRRAVDSTAPSGAPTSPMSALDKAASYNKTAPLSSAYKEELAVAEREARKPAVLADIVSVQVSGAPGAYRFSISITSPDIGCQQYADWWEVVGENGELLYRQVFEHSHVDRQPVTHAGGPVPIQPDRVVWVRAHSHPAGYGYQGFKGSVRAGFQRTPLASTFALALAEKPPRPDKCDF